MKATVLSSNKMVAMHLLLMYKTTEAIRIIITMSTYVGLHDVWLNRIYIHRQSIIPKFVLVLGVAFTVTQTLFLYELSYHD